MTRIGEAIIREALSWVDKSCKETVRNGGSCIDDLQAAYDLSARREAYCAKFVWVCTDAGCQTLGIENHLPKTAGARNMRDLSRKSSLRTDLVMAPGAIFYRYSTAGATGHMGICLGWNDRVMYSAEGNRGDRIDVFQNELAAVKNPKNGYEFIHTELMPGGQDEASSTVVASPPLWVGLIAAGGLGYYLYEQGVFDELMKK